LHTDFLTAKSAKNAKLPEIHQVTLKVLRWEERDNRLVIKDAGLVS